MTPEREKELRTKWGKVIHDEDWITMVTSAPYPLPLFAVALSDVKELFAALSEAEERAGVFMGDAQFAEHHLALAREVVEAARECHCKWQVSEAIKRYDEGEM